MSDKSGIPSQVISLPKGGGALSGIGETFSPDLHTGTGNFTVPIALPPGCNGFQPELNLGCVCKLSLYSKYEPRRPNKRTMGTARSSSATTETSYRATSA